MYFFWKKCKIQILLNLRIYWKMYYLISKEFRLLGHILNYSDFIWFWKTNFNDDYANLFNKSDKFKTLPINWNLSKIKKNSSHYFLLQSGIPAEPSFHFSFCFSMHWTTFPNPIDELHFWKQVSSVLTWPTFLERTIKENPKSFWKFRLMVAEPSTSPNC